MHKYAMMMGHNAEALEMTIRQSIVVAISIALIIHIATSKKVSSEFMKMLNGALIAEIALHASVFLLLLAAIAT